MIKVMENRKTLISTFRKMLIQQTELPQTRILNSNSVRGQDLDKLVDYAQDTYEGYKLYNLVVLFEFENENSDNNVSFTNRDETLNQYNSYRVKLIIYGDNSNVLANKLKTRLLSSKVISDLFNSGILLYDISPIETINEFINNTYWNRCDMSIYLSCRYEYTQVNKEYTPEEENKLELFNI